MAYHIAVLGDFNPDSRTHLALNNSARALQQQSEAALQFDWTGTEVFDTATMRGGQYCGLWIAPGSPYKDMENVLHTITYAREHNIPTLGNCGGFQHMLIEFAQRVCGITHAGHEESHPDTQEPLIYKLSCSLTGLEEQLHIPDNNSQLYNIAQVPQLTGRYNCSYGLNPAYREALETHGLRLTAFNKEGAVRAFELPGHPFFLGTLFQPALTSTTETINPILKAFVSACINS